MFGGGGGGYIHGWILDVSILGGLYTRGLMFAVLRYIPNMLKIVKNKLPVLRLWYQLFHMTKWQAHYLSFILNIAKTTSSTGQICWCTLRSLMPRPRLRSFQSPRDVYCSCV